MSKTYILEPTELEFSSYNKGGLIASLETTLLYYLNSDELRNLIPNGAIIDINNGDKFISYSDDLGTIGTRDGAIPESQPEEYAEFILKGELKTLRDLRIVSTVTTEPGTYTVSIYTETEDAPTPKYPVKNTSYELHGHSDVERIRYKLKKKAEQGDGESGSESSGGSSVSETSVMFVNYVEDPNTYEVHLDRTCKEIIDAFKNGTLVCCLKPYKDAYMYSIDMSIMCQYQNSRPDGDTVIDESSITFQAAGGTFSFRCESEDSYPEYIID